MRVYYINDKIIKVWREVDGAMPEDEPRLSINVPHGVIEIDEWYNRKLCYYLLRNSRFDDEGEPLPDLFYVQNGKLYITETQQPAPIVLNPQKEEFKLSQLYGLTQQQLENYIDNNVTNLAEAKEYIKKLSAVVLWLVKQTRMDE